MANTNDMSYFHLNREMQYLKPVFEKIKHRPLMDSQGCSWIVLEEYTCYNLYVEYIDREKEAIGN